MRDQGIELNSIILSEHLDKYAETGQQYVKTIQKIINQNNLKDFDDAKLLPSSEETRESYLEFLTIVNWVPNHLHLPLSFNEQFILPRLGINFSLKFTIMLLPSKINSGFFPLATII